MKTALRLLTLARNYFRKPTRTPMPVVCFLAALCVFAWIENSMLTSQNPCPVSKPSAACHVGDVFICSDTMTFGASEIPQAYMQIDFSDALPFPCPAERRCS